MPGGTSRRIYSPMTQNDVIDQLRSGLIPSPFIRRMRLINLMSASALQKIEDVLFAPWTVLKISAALNEQTSQDYIITTIRDNSLQIALWHGDTNPLWGISSGHPKLQKGFYTGWIQKFFWTPFDPLCVMLAMRVKLLLDILDELGHSYDLMRALGFGFIDLGEIPDETPGDPGDYYPPEIDDPIQPPGPPPPVDPGPGEPDVPPGYVDPSPQPGDPGFVEPGPGDPGYYEAAPTPGDPGFVEPGPGDPGYRETLSGSGGKAGIIGSGISTGAPWNLSFAPGSLGGRVRFGRPTSLPSCDPCVDFTDPESTPIISYTTLGMQVDETQDLSVSGQDPECPGYHYSWLISHGGGTLSAGTGLTVTYTAPSENPECEQNPTIQLWCGGNLMDSITIAVNAYTEQTNAYNTPTITYSAEAECGAGHDCACIVDEADVYDCAGSFLWHFDSGVDDCGCTGVLDPEDGLCWVGMPCDCEEESQDLRDPDEITAGCCPEALL